MRRQTKWRILGKCARNSATFRRMTVFRFYGHLHGRATVSLSQAQVIAAVEVF
jgi:xanthosine utilization system XapX-like protein